MKFKLQVDGREYVITAAADGSVTIDGETFETRTGAAAPDRRMIRWGRRATRSA